MNAGLTWLQDGVLGEWWLPSTPSKKIVGALRVVHGLWQLQLYGLLGQYQQTLFDRRYERIDGWVPSIGFVAVYDGVARKTKFMGPTEFVREIERVDFAYLLRQSVGAQYLPEQYQAVLLGSRRLFDWFGSNGLSELKSEAGKDSSEMTFTYVYRRPKHVEKKWGNWSLLFWMKAGEFPFPIKRELRISQDCAIQLSYPSGLAFFEYQIKRKSLDAFLSLLAGTNFDLEIFSIEPEKNVNSDPNPYPMGVLINQKKNQATENHEDEFKYYFSFGDISNRFEELLLGWDSIVGSVYGNDLIQYFSSIQNKDATASFLASCNLLHGIVEVDERHKTAKENAKVPFEIALAQQAALYLKDANLVEDTVNLAKAARHSLTHPQSHLKPVAPSGLVSANLQVFMDSLLRCCVWSHIGFTNGEILSRIWSHQSLEDKISMNYWRTVE